ncbi:MAG: transposase [Bryobacterales bacterium]|nr:transposase [Bryobacterales bacterium]
MHFTPASASGLNTVERFFRDLTEYRLRRGVFRDVEDLIGSQVDQQNDQPKPFIRTAIANVILEKVKRATRFKALEPLRQGVREPEGNGCMERFFRTLKEQLLWVRHFQNREELQIALREFRDRYNREWLIERLRFQSPRQARERLRALQQAA